jgi:hypothetical protein
MAYIYITTLAGLGQVVQSLNCRPVSLFVYVFATLSPLLRTLSHAIGAISTHHGLYHNVLFCLISFKWLTQSPLASHTLLEHTCQWTQG